MNAANFFKDDFNFNKREIFLDVFILKFFFPFMFLNFNQILFQMIPPQSKIEKKLRDQQNNLNFLKCSLNYSVLLQNYFHKLIE